MRKVKKSTFMKYNERKRADYLEAAMDKGLIEDHKRGRLYVKALREVAELKGQNNK